MRVAAYARYSTDMQREASLEDQLRNCRAYCEREGWPAPAVYSDAGTSGARIDRPGYQDLLANAGRFDVLLVDDLTRFGRDSGELDRTIKRLTFAGLRIIGVSDGIDTAQKSHKINTGMRGLLAEVYLDDLADKTHRGLTGRALAGRSAGGLPYGYRRGSEPGERIIDPDQAEVVRRIFAAYIDGHSPRDIANMLNREGIQPARGRTWSNTAIYGDLRRGIGILANPIYIGRQVWNRSRWVKNPETGRRVRRERPESEWIITEHPELAIVDRATWDAAQAHKRQRRRETTTGRHRGGPGRPGKHLLSGILRCPECGGPLAIVDRYRYGCSVHKNRGDAACANSLRVPRAPLEQALLAGIQRELLTEAHFQEFQRQVTAALKKAAPDLSAAKKRVTAAERERDNIMAAIRAGIITETTKAEMQRAEDAVRETRAELDALRQYQPAQVLPRARERWRTIVASLGDVARDTPTARSALRELLGENITLHEKAGEVFATIAGSDCQINMVAGARSVLYLTRPLSIPIPLPGSRKS